MKFTFIATTLFGLEETMASELKELGAEQIKILNRAVEFSGSLALMYKINLCLRTGLRILLHLKSFTVKDEEHLYNEILKIEWENLFDGTHSFAISSIVNSPLYRHSRFIAQKSKDAVADRFRKSTGKRPSVDLTDPDIVINVHVDKNRADISLDSSGSPLFKRGYRSHSHEAPLNEVLAAGLIRLSGWDSKESCLYDPMCGSGTIAIEAVMTAANIFPGQFRNHFAFFNWKTYDSSLFSLVKSRLPVPRMPEFPVYASDISSDAIRKTKTNVGTAGLNEYIRITCLDFFKSYPPEKKGIIIMNPPYGERLSDPDLKNFYRMIGNSLKNNYSGYTAWLISPNMEALKYVGLHPEKKINLINGNLKCRYQKYSIYEGSRKNSNLS